MFYMCDLINRETGEIEFTYKTTKFEKVLEFEDNIDYEYYYSKTYYEND